MQEPVYRRLAGQFDATPNCFPATESGAELRLLAKSFSPQEAELASAMRLTLETAAGRSHGMEIAAHQDPRLAVGATTRVAQHGVQPPCTPLRLLNGVAQAMVSNGDGLTRDPQAACEPSTRWSLAKRKR